MVQGGMSVVKFLMFAFNFVFVVCGIALIVVGAIAQSSGKEFTAFLNSKFVTAPTIIIVVGCIIFIVAFFGCWGAVKQNYCMVVTFGVLMFLIFIIEISAGIAAYVYRNEVKDAIKDNMNQTLNRTTHPDTANIWNEMESKWKCCGVEGPDDYQKQQLEIPASCCGVKVGQTCDKVKAFQKGCYNELKDRIDSKLTMVGGAGIAIAVIEILGMIFAWCLASAIKKEYEGV